jgi:hypothetical protein
MSTGIAAIFNAGDTRGALPRYTKLKSGVDDIGAAQKCQAAITASCLNHPVATQVPMNIAPAGKALETNRAERL